METGPRGFWAQPLRKVFQSLTKEGSAPFKTIYFKKFLTFLVKAVGKSEFKNQGHYFMVVKSGSHQFVAVESLQSLGMSSLIGQKG